jgi:hypothetical protein
MHTIQYVAVQADDTDMAFRSVKDYLETQLGNDPESPTNTWFDWFVTGGGRWASDDSAQYDDNFMGDVVHQDSPKFQEYLDTAKRYRQESLVEYADQATKVDYTKIINDIVFSEGDDFRGAMELYPIKKLYDMGMGTWDYNSYYFDVIHDSASMIHLQNSLDNGAKDWYLVPVDFHF